MPAAAVASYSMGSGSTSLTLFPRPFCLVALFVMTGTPAGPDEAMKPIWCRTGSTRSARTSAKEACRRHWRGGIVDAAQAEVAPTRDHGF